MPGEKQMVPGFNHNVKHKGTPYHVQTEDSGIDNPRIITHLFVGGNVIASKKTSYADIVGAENLAQVVRELMEEQHKEMLRNLISGVYDDTEEEVAAKARAYQPGQIAGPERSTVARSPGASESQRAAAEAGPAKPAASAKPVEPPRAPEAAKPAVAPRPPPIPRPASAPPQRPSPIGGATAERPPARPAAAPPVAQAAPSPQAVRALGAQLRSPAPAAQAAASPGGGRRDDVDAAFGEDLISEKSLDEVILSYLAEDQAGKA